jgi:lysylphosphatidylglycerol synthetase-like protein (DUF2156 family)
MEKMSKIISILLFVLFGITAILAIMFISNIGNNVKDPDMLKWLDINLFWTYILLISSVVLLLIFGIFEGVANFKQSKKGILALLGMVAIVVVSYLLGSDEIPKFLGADKFVEQGIISPSICKWVDTGLFTTYAIFALSLVAFAYSSLTRFFR